MLQNLVTRTSYILIISTCGLVGQIIVHLLGASETCVTTAPVMTNRLRLEWFDLLFPKSKRLVVLVFLL